LPLKIQLLKEAGPVAGVTRPGHLFDLEEESVTIAIGKPADDSLFMAARLSFQPKLLTGSAPKVHKPGFQSAIQSISVHPPEHQHPTRGV
jgi:hypothetical protein